MAMDPILEEEGTTTAITMTLKKITTMIPAVMSPRKMTSPV